MAFNAVYLKFGRKDPFWLKLAENLHVLLVINIVYRILENTLRRQNCTQNNLVGLKLPADWLEHLYLRFSSWDSAFFQFYASPCVSQDFAVKIVVCVIQVRIFIHRNSLFIIWEVWRDFFAFYYSNIFIATCSKLIINSGTGKRWVASCLLTSSLRRLHLRQHSDDARRRLQYDQSPEIRRRP